MRISMPGKVEPPFIVFEITLRFTPVAEPYPKGN